MITRTRADASIYAASLIGMTRDHLPVPWTADPGIDDCARFCSHVIWGGKPGPISWVDNFKTAGDGIYMPGDDDLQPYDVILFDWEGNGVGNHVEFFVSFDPDTRYIRTYGANGSDTRAAAYRRRPRSYILGHFRPRWATVVAAPQASLNPSVPIASRRPRMFTIVPVTTNPKVPAKAAYVCGPSGKRAPIRNTEHRDLLVRYRDNDGSDTMLTAEMDIVRSYLKRVA